MKSNFHTQYDHADPVIDFTGEESLARQEFATDCDINNIIKRYQATGVLIDPSTPRTRKPLFGDFSNIPSYQQYLDIVLDAQQRFDSLPVEIRARFNYDPGALLSFVKDTHNRDEAVRLGLIEAPAKPVSPAGFPGVAEPSTTAPSSAPQGANSPHDTTT